MKIALIFMALITTSFAAKINYPNCIVDEDYNLYNNKSIAWVWYYSSPACRSSNAPKKVYCSADVAPENTCSISKKPRLIDDSKTSHTQASVELLRVFYPPNQDGKCIPSNAPNVYEQDSFDCYDPNKEVLTLRAIKNDIIKERKDSSK